MDQNQSFPVNLRNLDYRGESCLGQDLPAFLYQHVLTLKGNRHAICMSILESFLKTHDIQAHRPSELKEASVSYFS